MGELAQAAGSKLTPCSKDSDRWFPEGYLGKQDPGDVINGEPDYWSEESMAARAECAGCWFQNECLEIGIQTGAEYGLYGGKDPDERTIELARRTLRGA